MAALTLWPPLSSDCISIGPNRLKAFVAGYISVNSLCVCVCVDVYKTICVSASCSFCSLLVLYHAIFPVRYQRGVLHSQVQTPFFYVYISASIIFSLPGTLSQIAQILV